MKKIILIYFLFSLFFIDCKNKQHLDVSDKGNFKSNEIKKSKDEQIFTPVIGLNLGNEAPEIAQKNLHDSVLTLSSLRGKLVLIDFWASWCRPCRIENPNVVEAYTKYKNRKFKNGNGFAIYSVSLDSDKNLWLNAIKKDGLNWPYHVSDLKAWNNEASQKYNVLGIPYNFLINKDGIIINKNLRGEDLFFTLEKLVVNE